MKWGFQLKINWDKYQLKVTRQEQNQCLDYLIDPSCQGESRLFVLSGRRLFSYNWRNKKLKYRKWWKKFFVQPVKNNLRTYDNIRKIATDQRDDYTTDCLLDYPYFKKHYKIIAIDLYISSNYFMLIRK